METKSDVAIKWHQRNGLFKAFTVKESLTVDYLGQGQIVTLSFVLKCNLLQSLCAFYVHVYFGWRILKRVYQFCLNYLYSFDDSDLITLLLQCVGVGEAIGAVFYGVLFCKQFRQWKMCLKYDLVNAKIHFLQLRKTL